jgi:hypothetical protein
LNVSSSFHWAMAGGANVSRAASGRRRMGELR